MRSLRTKITLLTVAAILVSVVSVGIISVIAAKRAQDKSAEQTMRLLCDNRAYSIETYLSSVEESVNMLSRLAQDSMDAGVLRKQGAENLTGSGAGMAAPRRSAAQQAELDRYLHGYLSGIEGVFQTAANYTRGVAAFYYRISPELSAEETGFLYSRIGLDAFEKLPLTELENYAPDDEAHVAWYYVPYERGKACWLDPYDNDNLGIRMQSYVTPLYRAGSFLGVLGMDISYDTLVNQIRDLQVFETGYAYLLDSSGAILYHPWLEYRSKLADHDPALASELARMLDSGNSGSLLQYRLEGVRKYMCFTTLRNGMTLAVCAPASEINETWLRLSERILFAAYAILLVFIAAAVFLMRRVTRPLKSLAAAAKSLSEGDYNVELDCSRTDEVGVLTRAFQELVEHLKTYITDLNSKAYQDAMTGVKNKGAFALFSSMENDAIAAGNEAGLALVMLDCNDLKRINDLHGHEKGDVYLRNACLLICETFPHSPVFRMGGDEFVVVLQGAAYAEREELLRQFDAAAERKNAAAGEPWERVSIAKGVAVYDPALDRGVEDVLRRADERMYAHKRECKSAARAAET